ncbi:M28 family peptidase [Bacteroidota bacterium]
MKNLCLSIVLIFITGMFGFSQTNIRVSNPLAEEIMLGNYDPADYAASEVIDLPDAIIPDLVNRISTDSLLAYLQKLDSFYQRNTGSDTISDTRGIGATRRWIFNKFEAYSRANQNRLIVSYLDFDRLVCGMNKHKNVMAVLPGRDTTNKEILLVEGHFDTRCEGGCDTSCYTPGIDDNASGTVLVMELARVMSRYSFNRTIVFTPVTGEDQGLHGAKAMAKYVAEKGISVMACFNNDVVGGVTCGSRSSPPSCPGLNHVDSTNVRLFSYSTSNDSAKYSKHKQLARYIKLNQIERINPLLHTPMNINIIISEDRTGRSGDHIPFRQRGIAAIRFCSQNEHGSGGGNFPDRQHSTRDILGIDTNSDGEIDSLFIDLNYLKRNAISNGVNLGLLANAPAAPEPEFEQTENGVILHLLADDAEYNQHRVGVRSRGSGSLYFDTVLTFNNSIHLEINDLDRDKDYYFSVLNVENESPGLFSTEFLRENLLGLHYDSKRKGINLGQNIPNPFNNNTLITIDNSSDKEYNNAEILVMDQLGRSVKRIPTYLGLGENEVMIENLDTMQGVLLYSLVIDGNFIQSKRMLMINKPE